MNNDAQINHISDWNNYLSTRNRFISFYMDAWMTIATETMAYESIDSRKKKKKQLRNASRAKMLSFIRCQTNMHFPTSCLRALQLID